uniref:Uncharacterized protein n=1 Tax=viral metagenome TaxID=1070528 RepID=A0A6H1Z7I6_9ZZZZ
MEIPEEEIIRRYTSGEAVATLAKSSGETKRLYKVLKKHGIPLRMNRHAPQKIKEPPEPVSRKSRGLSGIAAIERGIQLTSARKWVHKYGAANPEATPAQAQEALEGATGEIVSRSTVRHWLERRKATASEPASEPPPEPPPDIVPADIADALLSRVVKYLHDYDSLLEDRAKLKEMAREVSRLGNELKQVKIEKERLLKIHNDQVKRQSITSVAELQEIASGKELSHARQRN